ncbi:uncharacterized protein BJX67DRAFT_18541 [Aspergillus lucknowensis]|uniref:Uncharacterized protein n=1 Tax=Aspergillus lucknowensis TaxID=176173 RepID=A0ABR4M883_9EURO
MEQMRVGEGMSIAVNLQSPGPPLRLLFPKSTASCGTRKELGRRALVLNDIVCPGFAVCPASVNLPASGSQRSRSGNLKSHAGHAGRALGHSSNLPRKGAPPGKRKAKQRSFSTIPTRKIKFDTRILPCPSLTQLNPEKSHCINYYFVKPRADKVSQTNRDEMGSVFHNSACEVEGSIRCTTKRFGSRGGSDPVFSLVLWTVSCSSPLASASLVIIHPSRVRQRPVSSSGISSD